MTLSHPLADTSEYRRQSVCSQRARELALVHSQKFGEVPPDDDDDRDSLSSLERAKKEAIAAYGKGGHNEVTTVQGTAGVGRAVFMLIKAFVGTGILFLPKAFENGGLVFSSVVMLLTAALSLWSYLLLVWAREDCKGSGGSFGDIAEYVGGKWMRFIVQASIALSQLGFVCAYMIFIAENLRAFTLNLSHCDVNIDVGYFIVMQLALFIPFAMIRRIEKLGFVSLIAEALILYGIGYVYYYSTATVVERGFASPLKMFNAQDFALFIGTAVYSFEGIGLVIPITESMREPHKFPRVLTITLVIVSALFISVGALGYAAFGSQVQPMIVSNLPQGTPIVYSIQLLYALAIAFSVPLQLFPAITILEKGIFGYSRSGRVSHKWKWSKNFFRTGLLVVCVLVSWVGANDLDKFVSLIGSFACIPLCFIYPPLFHMRSGNRTRKQKIFDILLIILGVAVMVYATVITIMQMISGEHGVAPDICLLMHPKTH